MDQSEFVVEYPNGKRMHITEDGMPLQVELPRDVIAFAETLEVLPDPFPHAAHSPCASEDSTGAATDVLIAVIALHKACMRFLESQVALSREECEAFVAFGRDRLQAVSLAAPCLKGGK